MAKHLDREKQRLNRLCPVCWTNHSFFNPEPQVEYICTKCDAKHCFSQWYKTRVERHCPTCGMKHSFGDPEGQIQYRCTNCLTTKFFRAWSESGEGSAKQIELPGAKNDQHTFANTSVGTPRKTGSAPHHRASGVVKTTRSSVQENTLSAPNDLHDVDGVHNRKSPTSKNWRSSATLTSHGPSSKESKIWIGAFFPPLIPFFLAHEHFTKQTSDWTGKCPCPDCQSRIYSPGRTGQTDKPFVCKGCNSLLILDRKSKEFRCSVDEKLADANQHETRVASSVGVPIFAFFLCWAVLCLIGYSANSNRNGSSNFVRQNNSEASPRFPNEKYISAYERSDGTTVRGHWRTEPDSSFPNNFTSIGNQNPHTGVPGTKRQPKD